MPSTSCHSFVAITINYPSGRFILPNAGDPQMTGTGTLTVRIEDINDNFPRFREDYQPHVPEGRSRIPATVQTVFAEDPDAPPYASPFGFAFPQCPGGVESCPCEINPTCDSFDLVFDPCG